MSDFFNLDFYKELPLFWQIIFGFVALILSWFTFLMKNQSFRKMVGNGLRKLFHHLSGQDVLIHPLFYNKKYYLNQLNNIEFHSKIKTDLFRILLEELITASIEIPFNSLSKAPLKRLDPQQVRNFLFDMLMKINKQYMSNTAKRFVELHGIVKGRKLFGLIYESEKGFKNHHNSREIFITSNIERVLFSKSKNLNDSVRTILTQIDIAIDLSILDCEDTFEQLNGKIEELANQQL